MSSRGLVLLGPPGAGKGTQAVRLCDEFGLLCLSSGQLLREEVEAGTELGRRAAACLDRGELVPDELVAEMVLARLDSRAPAGFALDGFPRTVGQARALDEGLAARAHGLSGTVLLDIPDEEVVRRLASRGREDDDADVVRNRLRVYHASTEPLVSFYSERGLLERVDGTGSPDEVYDRLRAAVADRL